MKKILYGILLTVFALNCYATSGRTNSQGCHNSKAIGYHCHGVSSKNDSINNDSDNSSVRKNLEIGKNYSIYNVKKEKDGLYRIDNPQNFNLFKNSYLIIDSKEEISKIYSYEEMDAQKCKEYLLSQKSANLSSYIIEDNLIIKEIKNIVVLKCSEEKIFYIKKKME